MKSLGCVLIPYDWHPYKVGKSGQTHTAERQWEDTEKIVSVHQGEDRAGTQPPSQASEGTNPTSNLILDFWLPEL